MNFPTELVIIQEILVTSEISTFGNANWGG